PRAVPRRRGRAGRSRPEDRRLPPDPPRRLCLRTGTPEAVGRRAGDDAQGQDGRERTTPGGAMTYYGPSRGFPIRYLIAAAIALFGLIGYFTHTSVNPTTGEKEHVSLSPEQETALGV